MLIFFIFFPFSLVWAGTITDVDDILGSGEDPENSGLQEATIKISTMTMATTTTATTVQSSVNTGNKLVSYPTLYKGCIASVGDFD